MCRSLGYDAVTASSGEEGLRLASQSPFDIVLTDLAMPGISGLEVARRLRRVQPETPVVLVTGDEAACAEAREFFPGCETVAVKYAINRNSALVIHPQKAQEMIREAAKRALKQVGKVEPLKIDYPAEVLLEFTRSDYADTRADTPGVVRVDARTVKWTANNAVELRV